MLLGIVVRERRLDVIEDNQVRGNGAAVSFSDKRAPGSRCSGGCRRAANFQPTAQGSRMTAGLTQEALAERAGLSVCGIQDLERGVTRPLKDTAQRLIGALALGGTTRRSLSWRQVRRRGAGHTATCLCRRMWASAAPQAPAEAPRIGLPVQLTLIGRENDLSASSGDVVAPGRAVADAGRPCGIGKTRLAIEVGTGCRGICRRRGVRRAGNHL